MKGLLGLEPVFGVVEGCALFGVLDFREVWGLGLYLIIRFAVCARSTLLKFGFGLDSVSIRLLYALLKPSGKRIVRRQSVSRCWWSKMHVQVVSSAVKPTLVVHYTNKQDPSRRCNVLNKSVCLCKLEVPACKHEVPTLFC